MAVATTPVTASTTETSRSSTGRRSPAVLATRTGSGFLAVVGALHVLKPELDPSWRMVSEYELGRHGWLMRVAFALLAVTCVAVHRALRGAVAGSAGTVGRGALLLAAVGTALAGLFATDPITATSDQLTTHGNLHGLGFMLGMPGLLATTGLVTRSLRRTGVAGLRTVRCARAAVAASVATFVAVMISTYEGAFGPDVPVGWPNRLLVVSLTVWLIAVAARLTANEQ